MSLYKISIFFLFCFTSVDAKCQVLTPNFCDSLVLTETEFFKCKTDSVYSPDIILRINYISALQTELLPKCKIQRLSLLLPDSLKHAIKQLKSIYDSTLNNKLNTFESGMVKKLSVQPKAYISTLLSFQVLRIYPNVYGILFNEIHLVLQPQTSFESFVYLNKMFDNVLNKIPPDIYQQVEKINVEIQADKARLLKGIQSEPFGGLISDELRIKYEIVNFLIWTE